MLDSRLYGILMPVASLPGPHGIGDFGEDAYRFADFLHKAGAGVWQILPLSGTSAELGNSPYSSFSAFAGNTLFISPDILRRDGLLTDADLHDAPRFNSDAVEYDKVYEYKLELLNRACRRFAGRGGDDSFGIFCARQSSWLDDYSLYMALKRKFENKPWYDWPEEFRDRRHNALDAIRKELAVEINLQKIGQYLFSTQWQRLKAYCSGKNIRIFGDIPIYVNSDSSDTWSNQELFKLDSDRRPSKLSGVPPDYFSKTGQLWGNPVYDWNRLRETGFAWWMNRLSRMFELYDVLRIDHFRGLVAYWEIERGEKTAINGHWVKAPHEDFFARIHNTFNGAPIIAEDLGVITKDVEEVRDKYGYPGMKVLQFAFDSGDAGHGYLPHNFIENCIVYTGTHDNNTALGWYRNDASDEVKSRLIDYAGCDVNEQNVTRTMIRLALSSVASWAIIPIQDCLGLGSEARINVPASPNGHWKWRLRGELLSEQLSASLNHTAQIYRRITR